MTAFQLSEWEAYDKLDPIGEWRDDYRWATLFAQLTNLITWAHAKKPTKHTALDFMPNWTGEEQEPVKQSVEQIKEALLAFAKTHNKKEAIQAKKTQQKEKKNG